MQYGSLKIQRNVLHVKKRMKVACIFSVHYAAMSSVGYVKDLGLNMAIVQEDFFHVIDTTH
eukprot:gene6406-7431_t